ncbi:MAG: 4Fe-4S dicluster domain-containing protein [Deltaproteobacteria bacterium]|nr:4Fe-4S dicluster domain-containing protein [Deltaproteobacteria bacterium]MDP3015911.1 4Fe-4S dicluster domain-containing protein [Deltaproteobacteria bacterium]
MDKTISNQEMKKVDTKKIKELLNRRKGKMKRFLSYCAHCSLCAESCFLYMKYKKDPKYMPSYKVIHSLGRLYKKRGKVDWKFLNEIKGIVWRNCVLCGRCYCPIGIHVPSMIAFARTIVRSQEVYPQLDETSSESWL